MRFRKCWHLDTKSHRLFVYSRLTATDPNRVQTGALHASVVHPGFTQWVVPPLVHTQSWTNTWWGEELKIIHFFINWWVFFKGKCLGFFFLKRVIKNWISPLELKWHSMGAAEPPLVHRRNPTAPSNKWTLKSSIFITSGQLVIPLLLFFPHLYALRVHDHGVEVWLAPSCGPQTWLWRVSAVPSVGNEEVEVLCRGEGKVVSWHAFGTLEISSMRFSRHEPPKC